MLFRSIKMHFKDIIIFVRVDMMSSSRLTANSSPQTLTSGVLVSAMSGNSVLLDASAILKMQILFRYVLKVIDIYQTDNTSYFIEYNCFMVICTPFLLMEQFYKLSLCMRNEHEADDIAEVQNKGYSKTVKSKTADAHLFHYIRNEVISNKMVVPVTQLTEKLKTFMSCKGEVLNTVTKKNIRGRVESELGDSVHIFPNDSGKLLLAPDSLSFKDVVPQDNENLGKDLAVWKVKLTDANKITDQASSQISEAKRTDMTPTPWPCHPSDLSNAVNMPTQLHRFLVGLLTGNPENENPCQRECQIVSNHLVKT